MLRGEPGPLKRHKSSSVHEAKDVYIHRTRATEASDTMSLAAVFTLVSKTTRRIRSDPQSTWSVWLTLSRASSKLK